MKKLLLLSAFLVSFVSCRREGCTDKNALNYEEKARKDCSCCEYEGSVVFWYGKETAAALVFSGASSLTYYLENEIVGSSAADLYWTGAPECGQNSSVTVKRSLGTSKNKSFTYKVVDQLGMTVWSGIANFSGNTCEKIELTK